MAEKSSAMSAVTLGYRDLILIDPNSFALLHSETQTVFSDWRFVWATDFYLHVLN